MEAQPVFSSGHEEEGVGGEGRRKIGQKDVESVTWRQKPSNRESEMLGFPVSPATNFW